MYKETLRSIDGVSLFPVIAIIIFIVFFLIVLFFTFRMDKKQVFQFLIYHQKTISQNNL